MEISFCLNILVILLETDTLIDRSNLCHSRSIIQILLIAEIFVSPVIWDFVQHFWRLVLVSQFVCHFHSHFCLVLAFVNCAF